MVFFIATNNTVIVFEEIEDFQTYLDNYIYEGRIVMNHAILNQKNISGELINYTDQYIEYAATKNIEVGIVFMYSYDSRLHIVNYLKDPILISPGEISVDIEEEYIRNATDIDINYRNTTYSFAFTPQENHFKALFIKQNG